MKIYSTHKKQKETLRHFFVSNSKWLAIGVVIGVSSLVGWRYWHNPHKDALMIASSTWQQINVSHDSQPQLDVAQQFANTNYNIYGALTSLKLAQYFVERGNYSAAEKQLQKALDQTHDANLQSLINLRLARVQLQKKNVDDALKTLENVKLQGWTALKEDIQGDAQVIKGDNQAARAAYGKVLQSDALKALVRMKLNNLPS